MANDGFKGSVVVLDKIAISSGPGGTPMLTCSVQFSDDSGNVHAMAQHVFALDPEGNVDGLAGAATTLIALAVARVESIHFDRPAGAKEQVLVGIAETLRSRTADRDEPGTQG